MGGAVGGGINNSEPGTVITLSDSELTQNDANGTGLLLNARGGGLADFGGNLTISNSRITHNQSIGDAGLLRGGMGGGIYSKNSAVGLLIDTTIANNVAQGGDDVSGVAAGLAQGGGIYAHGGTWSAVGATTIDSNIAQGGQGLAGTQLRGGDASGGGIHAELGTWTMNLATGSTISRNGALGGSGDLGGDAEGGGLYSSGGIWNMQSSTISNNSVIGGSGDSVIGVGGIASGGGLYTESGTAFFGEYLTVTKNDATGGAGLNRGRGDGGGFFGDPASGSFVNLHGSVVAANSSDTLNPDIAESIGAGSFSSSGYNLIGNVGSTLFVAGSGDLVGTVAAPIDPMLGPLQNNGGLTETHELLTGSPAIDTADVLRFPPTDQRGVARPQDGDGDLIAVSDRGAYEAMIVTGSSIDIEKLTNGVDADDPTGPQLTVGSTAVFTYVVTNTGAEPLTNVVVSGRSAWFDHQPHQQHGNGDTILDPAESWTYQAQITVTPGQHANVGTVNALDPLGRPLNDRDFSHHFGIGIVDSSIDIEKSTNGHDADVPTGPVVVGW